MVSYTTRAELRDFRAQLNEETAAQIRKRSEERSPKGATFLSHSSKDDDLVTGALRILENHGALVYLDKKDQEMPPYTNKKTASILKSRINKSKKFILLASPNSKDSRWVPWELGIADGYNEIHNIALFPAVDEEHQKSWASWEYLGLYDRIVFGAHKSYAKPIWMVYNEKNNTGTELSKWLQE